MHIGGLLARHARYQPDRLALAFEGRRHTWRDLADRVHRVANGLLAQGLRRGDRIATILPNSLELVELYWAAACTGLVIVPLSPLLRGNGLATLLADSGSSFAVTTPEGATELDAVRDRLPALPADRYYVTGPDAPPGFRAFATLQAHPDPTPPADPGLGDEDPFNIMYSSGTTGLPKGIVHTHQIRVMYGSLFSSRFRIHPESVILHAGSIVFNGAFLSFMPWWFQGTAYHLHARFDPEAVIDTIRRERVTHMVMVPSQIVAVLASPAATTEALASLEMICTVGAPFHHEHREALARVAPGVFYELYGLTEGFVTILDRDDYARKPDSVGTPPPLHEMRIVGEDGRDLPPGEVGEIVGRGPLLMPGYHGRPDLTAQAVRDGWLFTGDLGYVDEDGFLFLVDRKKDLIISGGANIYPRDIEEIAVAHPAVLEVAVFGAPDPKWGESPIAAVVLSAPAGAEELREWINARVDARFQQVREVLVLDAFPRNTAGKILKRVLREQYLATPGTSS